MLATQYKIDLVTYSLGNNVDIPNVKIYRTPNFFKPKIGVGKPGFNKAILDIIVLFKSIFLLLTNDYKIIHCEDFESALIGRILILFNNKIKFVYDLHNRLMDNLTSKELKLPNLIEKNIISIEKFIIKRCNLIVLNWKKYETEDIFRGKNFFTYYDQIDIKDLKESKIQINDYLVYVGNFEKYQGHDEFLKAYSNSKVTFKLLLIGETTKEVVNLINSNQKLLENVVTTGRLSIGESNFLISKSIAAILPRLHGSSMKALAYITLNKAIIAKNTNSSRELIVNDYNGYLYNNQEELINILNQIELSRESIGKLNVGVLETKKEILKNWDITNFIDNYTK